MEEEHVAPEVTDDMPPTQANAESRIEHESVVPEGVVEIHDGEHIDREHGEIEVYSEVDLPPGDTVVSAELTRELGPFYREAESHGVEAIFITTSDTSSQLGRSMIGDASPQTDGVQPMSSDSVVAAVLVV